MDAYNLNGVLGISLPENPLLMVIIWLLLVDLANYITHILMHRSNLLWSFHKFHHASTEMNIITGSRVSVAEQSFNDLAIVLILSVLIGLPDISIVLAVIVIRQTIDLLQHSDLPWDFGYLGTIVVSPRFHRLHHSSEVRYHNCNYGNIFSLWDYIFGTASLNFKNDPSIADKCVLGLDDATESRRLNNWKTAIFHATVFEYFYSMLLVVKSKRRSSFDDPPLVP